MLYTNSISYIITNYNKLQDFTFFLIFTSNGYPVISEEYNKLLFYFLEYPANASLRDDATSEVVILLSEGPYMTHGCGLA